MKLDPVLFPSDSLLVYCTCHIFVSAIVSLLLSNSLPLTSGF